VRRLINRSLINRQLKGEYSELTKEDLIELVDYYFKCSNEIYDEINEDVKEFVCPK
jgi:hypothetical protein